LRGEWERLEIPYVRGKHPQFVGHYTDQARLTLRRAYDRGERDPGLLAARALCELDAANEPEARILLEQAVAARPVRPRVYFELARLRWAELVGQGPGTRLLTPAEIRPIVEPLRTAITQAPPLPEAFMLLADAWLRCAEPPPAAEMSAIAVSARLFVRIPAIGFRVALLQARQGRRAEAAAVIGNALPFVLDADQRRRFEQLESMLATVPSRGDSAPAAAGRDPWDR
jgi:hypothetical protein